VILFSHSCRFSNPENLVTAKSILQILRKL